VGLPELGAASRGDAATYTDAAGQQESVLRYHHFSVVMNARRRIAFYTAVNIDGRQRFTIHRAADSWILDPRLPQSMQIGNELYAGNKLDRGHLVRRLDPAWGASQPVALSANNDTFHFTNCSPQHRDFNQGQTLWAGLEDYILNNAGHEQLRANVFTGPVLQDADPEYRGVQLPRSFWKVVTTRHATGELSATAYLVSQDSLLSDLEEFSFGAYRTFQVPVHRIEELTGLSFNLPPEADPLGRLEALVRSVELRSLSQIAL
jgi:endonuclease G